MATEISTEISFYKLSSYSLQKGVGKLISGIKDKLQSNILLVSNSQKEMKDLDQYLWDYKSTSFIPHATMTEKNPETQPILLTTLADLKNSNKSNILFSTIPIQDMSLLKQYRYFIFMFDANDSNMLDLARSYWKSIQELDSPVKYWEQVQNKWEQKL